MYPFTLILIGAVLVVATRSPSPRWVVGITLGCLAALCLYPALILGVRDTFHVGIAPLVPELRTFSLVVGAVAVSTALPLRQRYFPTLWLPFFAWLALGMEFFWSGSSAEWSGIAQFACGAAGWTVGTYLGRRTTESEILRYRLAQILCGIVFVELVVTVMQRAGIHINSLRPQDAAILGDRVNGTANHPDNLGKILFLLVILLLPLTRSAERRTRLLALLGVGASIIPLGLAQGRANFISFALLVVMWAVLLPGDEGRRVRPIILAGAAVATIGFAVAYASRFSEDPGGGARGELNVIALNQIPKSPIHGLGPNNYTLALGPQTGSYIPVHNTFLLLTAELGIVGMLLFFLPIVVVLRRATRGRRLAGPAGDHARTLLASVPGILLIAATGWGMLGSSVLTLWLLVIGFTGSAMGARCKQGAARASTTRTVGTRGPVGPNTRQSLQGGGVQ